MPGGKSAGKSVKHPRIYEALRAEGMSKSQAAAISNAATPKHSPKHGKSKSKSGKGKH
jgi:hypothetical protein